MITWPNANGILLAHPQAHNPQGHFQQTSQQLRKTFWWQSTKFKVVLALLLIFAAVIIFLLACFTGGKNCTKPGGRR